MTKETLYKQITQTQEQQAQEWVEAQTILKTLGITKPMALERCVNPACQQTSLWVMDDQVIQVASVTHMNDSGSHAWKANHIYNGLPTTERYYETLTDALRFATSDLKA